MTTIQLTFEEIVAIKKMAAHAEEYELAMKMLDAEEKYIEKLYEYPSSLIVTPHAIITINDI